MFSKIVAALLLFLASASAFVPATARTMMKAGALSMKMDVGKSIASMIPAAIAAPAIASDVCPSQSQAFVNLLFYAFSTLINTFLFLHCLHERPFRCLTFPQIFDFK